MQGNRKNLASVSLLLLCFVFVSCQAIRTTYDVTEETVKATYKVAKFTAKSAYVAGNLIYHVGGFTFKVVAAPLSWPLTRQEIETMSVEQARHYRETGIASWYGYETYRQKGGRMTANGEAFDPSGLSAAHKYLPLPTFVKVTNLENRRSIILRVNDRGPFVDGRAAHKLGFYNKGTAKVRVETISAEG